MAAVEKLKELLPENFSLADLALKWILSHKEVTVAIPGAKNKNQVNSNARVTDLNNIMTIIPKINSIYDEYIKQDVHHRW